MRWRYAEYIVITVLIVGAITFLIQHAKEKTVFGVGELEVSVIGSTPTQAILSYTAPDFAPCTVEVSTSSNFTPVVHDVDATLFTGSNLDTRAGSTGSGTLQRTIVIGKRTAEEANDGDLYSRALEAYKTHYYQITCGSSIGSGTFSTANIPIGNNYLDSLPADPENPGSYLYPSLDLTNRSQEIIDPKTGLLIKQMTLPEDGLDPSQINFGAAGYMNHCASALSADAEGAEGYRCLIGRTLFWINASTGETRPLTFIAPPYDPDAGFIGGSCYWGIAMDFSKPGTLYCGIDDDDHNRLFAQVDYHGLNDARDGNTVLPQCNVGITNEPCLKYTLLTPQNNNFHEQLAAFDPRFGDFITAYGCVLVHEQNNRLLTSCTRSGQDTNAWLAVFDLTSKTIIAAMPTYDSGPLRWGVLHGIDYAGDIDWITFIQNTSARYPNTAYSSALTESITGTLTTCPTNSFGATGESCTDIHVDGEPCGLTGQSVELETPNPAKCNDPSRQYYLQDAEPGDFAVFGPRFGVNSETVRIIAKNENVWTIQRNIPNPDWYISARNQPSGTLLTMIGDGKTSWLWDFVNDPHGTNLGEDTVIFDPFFNGNHKVYRPNVSVEGDRIRQGAIPDFINAAILPVVADGPFAGLVEDAFYNLPWTVDEHPSESFDDEWFLDGKPWQGGHWPNTNGELVGGTLYKFHSNAYGGSGSDTILHPKLVPTLASSGRYPLVDMSGPSSSIGTGSSDNYKYCIAKEVGECYSGSAVGDLYVNAPNVTTPKCTDAGESGGDGWGAQDICIGDTGSRTNTIIQQGITGADSVGITGRVLTRGFVRYRRQDPYWNVHALPNANWFMFSVPNSDEYPMAGQLFIAKLPPFPASDGVDRTNFLPVPVTIPESSVDSAVSARTLFGYEENGTPTDFYCTSRRESCVSTNEGGNNYSFLSDEPTPVACANGCTITVPTVPDRVVYLKTEYLDVNGNIVDENSLQVAAGRPPYTVSVLPLEDSTSPLISLVSSLNIGPLLATISWVTDEPADTQVEYGTSLSYGSASSLNVTLGITHTVIITGLSANTTYHYQVKSRDEAGNLAVSADYTFTTSLLPPPSGGGGSSRSSHSSSGGSSNVPVPPLVVPSPVYTAPLFPNSTANINTSSLPLSSLYFYLNLYKGKENSEVLNLQKILVSEGFLSASSQTGYFGELTEAAVKSFQKKYGIATVSTPGYGEVGPATRSRLNAIVALATGGKAIAALPPPTPPSNLFISSRAWITKKLSINIKDPEVTLLQQFLIDQGLAKGTPTGFFGALTEESVRLFQKKYGIVSGGSALTTGFGVVGPKTREKINEMMGE